MGDRLRRIGAGVAMDNVPGSLIGEPSSNIRWFRYIHLHATTLEKRESTFSPNMDQLVRIL